MSNLMSPEYLALCQEMHNQKQAWGTTGHSYIDEFLPFVRKLRCQTLLDYSVKHKVKPRSLGPGLFPSTVLVSRLCEGR